MTTTNPVDAARIELMLSDLRLPAIKSMWAKLAEQSDKEGWPAGPSGLRDYFHYWRCGRAIAYECSEPTGLLTSGEAEHQDFP